MPNPPVKPRRYNYLSNKNILIEIARSKNSYCSYLEDHHGNYDLIITPEASQSLSGALSTVNWHQVSQDKLKGAENGSEAVLEPTCIVRVMTWEHVPEALDRPRRGREKNKTHERVCFPPFMHFEHTVRGGWVCVGKSHWTGGLHNGHFSNEHGRLTEELGKMIWELANRYSTRSSWRGYSYREDMVADAVDNLVENALKFDESRTQNPFAFYTTCVTNRFRRVWREEEQQQHIRDDLLISYGKAPSMTRQVADELARFEPVKLQAKRGRKPATKTTDA